MYRVELEYLKEWVHSDQRKPLVMRGARQVGKSTLVRLLASSLDLNLVEINFERHPERAALFDSNNPTEIINLLSLQLNVKITPGKTLLFLDEIQATPHLLAVLRYFYEELPQLHIIAAGSLLDFALEDAKFSMPVGRIEYMHLGPITFEGFLLAMGEKQLYDFLQQYTLDQSYPVPIHDKLMQLLKTYLIVGGMPEAVATYSEKKDFLAVEKIKHSILDTYVDDFSKYATKAEQNRLRALFNKAPNLIGKKFKYSHISPNEKSTLLGHALSQLRLARVVHCVYHSAANGVPLGAEINEKKFKVLFLDVGLVATSLGLSYLDVVDQQEIALINSGGIAEQLIGQHLLYLRPPYEKPLLYYWVREKKSSSAEVDYVVSKNRSIIPVEVKAGKTGTLKSLHYFVAEKEVQKAVRFNSEPPSTMKVTQTLADGKNIQYELISLPLYLVNQMYRFL